ncbi:Ig-like domain-containing protein [Amphritea sp.]|uniref:Ig-like domain-containing protein n=1 Tax=Amphritea sp. TaxID=1872502 RepID=UPI0025BAD707|nr:Ig-like domain-containing protein [Amphritea sp.]
MNTLRYSALLIGSLMLTSGSVQAVTYDICVGTTSTIVPSGDGSPDIGIPMWGYGIEDGGSCSSASVPGPQIIVPEGDTSLTINLRNTLTSAATSIMIPGQGLPDIGGVPVTFTDAQSRQRVSSFVSQVNSGGGTGTYTWNNIRPGTYPYQSGTHVQVQVQMGLYGAMTQKDSATTAYPGINYDQESLLIYSAIDPVLHSTVDAGNYGPTGTMTSTINYQPKYFLVNGQPYTTGSLPADIGPSGSTTLLRMINMDLDTHAPMLLGGYMDVIAESGYPYPYPRRQYSVNLAPGQSKDALLTLGEGSTVLSLFDRRLNTTNAGGTGGGLVNQFSVSGSAAGTDPLYYFSLFRGLNAGGVTAVPGLGNVENRDIVSYNPADGTWATVLDGSDFNLVRSNGSTMANIDALHVFADGRMLLSFDTPTIVPGVGGTGVVDDSDLVIFDPSLTSNSFSIAYTGTQLQLTSGAEDINALSLDVNGDLQVSTIGNVIIDGVTIATDEDVIRFSQATRTWEVMFDGSDLSTDFTANAADIDALSHPDANQLLMSILGNKNPLAGVNARDEDVLLYSGSFGLNNTTGLLETRLDMTAVTGALPGNADISAMSWSNGLPYDNSPPIPADDSYSLDLRLNPTLIVTAPGVLANDMDPDMNSLSVQPAVVTTTLGGSLDIAINGSFTYTPAITAGVDSADYTVIDGVGGSEVGSITFNVETSAAPTNEPPVGKIDRVSTPKNITLVIDVLANDTDTTGVIDPASVVITLQPKRGGTINGINTSTGEITFTPAVNFIGTDVFKYKVSDDGGLTSTAVKVRVNVTN